METTTFTIPEDHLALSIVAMNPEVFQGDDFRKDGWVYTNGVRRKKWFVGIPHTMNETTRMSRRIWEPKYNDIGKLEATLWKLLKRAHAWSQPIWDGFIEEMKVKKMVRGIRNPSRKGLPSGMIEVHGSDNGYGFGVGWSWQKDSKAPLDQDFVTRYTDYEERSVDVYRRVSTYRTAFLEAIHRKYCKTFRHITCPTIHFVINGRDYWLRGTMSEYSTYSFDVLSFPEDQLQVEVIG